MGLYNMILGENPYLKILLMLIQIPERRFCGRLRDGWISEDAKSVFLYHRNYGEGNKYNEVMANHPWYIGYKSSDGDETYATWEFCIPDDVPDQLKKIATRVAKESDNTPCGEKFRKVIEDLKNDVPGENLDRAMAAGKELMAGLNIAFEEGHPGTNIVQMDEIQIISQRPLEEEGSENEDN